MISRQIFDSNLRAQLINEATMLSRDGHLTYDVTLPLLQYIRLERKFRFDESKCDTFNESFQPGNDGDERTTLHQRHAAQ